ncbi:MAG: type 4a pilus biogenesis protein PilO [Bacteriovoracaceae bacterium]|nr:type 4a pilus biogenesis protein PilO [Bacteriovoracaceae bacterium]
MEKVLTKIHLIILLLAMFFAWEKYSDHLINRENLESMIPALHGQIQKREKQLLTLKKYFKDVEVAKKKIELVALEVEKRQKQFPNEISDPKNLQFFSDTAKEINMRDVYLSPGREEIKGFYITKEYTLKVSGTFLQFLVFLERIENQTQLFNIKSIHFNQAEKKQRGRFQLINGDIKILAYRYNSGFKEDRGFDKIDEDFKADQLKKKKVLKKK